MSLTSKWSKIAPGCYAEALPVVHLWNIQWPSGVAVGRWDEDGRQFLVFDGKGLRRVLVAPTHWRPLASPPYREKRVRVARGVYREALRAKAQARHTAMAADRAKGLSWHALAAHHGYRTGSAARESFKAREKFLLREGRSPGSHDSWGEALDTASGDPTSPQTPEPP